MYEIEFSRFEWGVFQSSALALSYLLGLIFFFFFFKRKLTPMNGWVPTRI